jgi:hypothetical protein
LQHLHHRLLDESIQHRRNPRTSYSSVRLRDFHPFHRLRLISPAQHLFPDDWPVLFQVLRQLLNGHTVHAGAPFVGLDSCQSRLQLSRPQTSSINCSPMAGLSVLRFTISDSVPSPRLFGAVLLSEGQ